MGVVATQMAVMSHHLGIAMAEPILDVGFGGAHQERLTAVVVTKTLYAAMLEAVRELAETEGL